MRTNSQTFQETLSIYQELITRELKIFFEKEIQIAAAISPHAKLMVERLQEFTLRGGKRIRPILVIIGFQTCNSDVPLDKILPVAISMELMQSFFLIHDDIIDEDILRRGKIAFHQFYATNNTYCNARHNVHFGESMGIVGGDIAAFLGTKLITESNFSQETRLAALKLFQEEVVKTCWGEMLDVLASQQKFSEQELTQILDLKTAGYSFETPLQLGRILAKKSSEEKDTLVHNVSIHLGRAFQLHDDILSIFGTEETIGKSIGNDIKEGKRTLLLLKTLENASKEQQVFIEHCLGKNNIQLEDVLRIREIMRTTGALDHIQTRAHQEQLVAKELIKNSKFLPEAKEFLTELAEYVVDRKS